MRLPAFQMHDPLLEQGGLRPLIAMMVLVMVGCSSASTSDSTSTSITTTVTTVDSMDVVIPDVPVDAADALSGFLAGDGAPLVAFHEAMAVLLADSADPTVCSSLVDVTLPTVAESPAALQEMAELVPDEEGRGIIINELAVGFETLGRCVGNEAILDVEEFEFHFRVVDEWLKEVGLG